MTDISVFEAMRSQRAIRRFTSEPVPDEAITRMIEAAIRAPNPGNRQPWYFLVIRDEEVKRRIGEYYRMAADENRGKAPSGQRPISAMYQSANELAQRMGEVPVLLLVCVDAPSPRAVERGLLAYGSGIYPAVQNLMLAARALGLGTCLTTLHRRYEEETKALLGIPANVETAALIPVGYPGEGEHFGGSRRKPMGEVAFYDHWGKSS